MQNRISLRDDAEVDDMIAILENTIVDAHDVTVDMETADEEERDEAGRLMRRALEFLDRLGYEHPLLDNRPVAGAPFDFERVLGEESGEILQDQAVSADEG